MKPKFFKYFTGFFVAATLWVIAACGGKDQNNPIQPVPPVYGYPNCLNCQNINGAVFFTGQSSDYSGLLQISWAFAGQNMMVQGVRSETYAGPVSTTGQLILSQNMSLGYCMIPAGTYSLGTVQVGQWGYGIVSNLALQAVGPASIVLNFYGQVSASSYLSSGQLATISASTGRMFGNLQVQSVNGQACPQIIGVK